MAQPMLSAACYTHFKYMGSIEPLPFHVTFICCDIAPGVTMVALYQKQYVA